MSHRLKLARAEEHLKAIELAVPAWRADEPYEFVHAFDLNTQDHVISFFRRKPYPDEWSVIAGDFLCNLRAALDHLVFSLCTKGKGHTLTNKEANGCCFPIYGAQAPTAVQLDRALPYIKPSARNYIESIQPSKAPLYADHILWGLALLNNTDKHRSLNAATTDARNFSVLSNDLEVTHVTPARPRLEHGCELARFGVVGPPELEGGHVQTHWDVVEVWDVPLPPGSLIPVDQGLRVMYEWVKKNPIARLESFL